MCHILAVLLQTHGWMTLKIKVKVKGHCTRHTVWVGVGSFSKLVATFNHVGGSFNLLMAITGDGWIIPSFQIWDYVLHVEHISCVFTNCGQHQRAILSLEEKHYQKISIPIFRDVLQNFAIPGYFPHILFYCYLFSLLSSGWFVIAVCGSISVRELVNYSESL